MHRDLYEIPAEHCTEVLHANRKRGRKPKIKPGQALVLPNNNETTGATSTATVGSSKKWCK